MPRTIRTALALLVLSGAPLALAQSHNDPEAARVEQAAIALVELLDAGRYDDAAATLRAGAARFDPSGAIRASGVRGAGWGVGAGIPSEAELQQQFETRRSRGRLSNRQAVVVIVQPLQSVIVAGREPAQQVRVVRVEFDTDPETPMLDRRRNAAKYYRESVGGLLMPSGELVLTSYLGAALHASDRVASTTGTPGNAAAQQAAAAAAATGTSAPEAVAIEQALEIAVLLDARATAEVLAKVRAGMPEHYATAAQWAPVARQLTSDFARRMTRGALSDRKVMNVLRSGGQGVYLVTLGATGAIAPMPPRSGPNPMGSVETVRVQVFGGAVNVLEYRFGF
jgi:hypothetical protein